MSHILEKNKKYIFNISDYFDVCYFNGFIVKSKTYDFCSSSLIRSERMIDLLKSYNFSGNIMIDLLAPNSWVADNRFFNVFFDGKNFNFKTFKIIERETISLKDLAMYDEYYLNNDFNFNWTVLTKEEIISMKNLRKSHGS